MLATIINAAAIIIGSLAGLFVRKGIPERLQKVIFQAAGMISLVVGFQMALRTTHILAFSVALILGGLAGTLLDIEGGILKFGERLKRRFSGGSEDSTFALGFLNASVLYCTGAMAIVGSFKAGTEGDFSLILTKSVLDGIMSVIFASAMGPGVIFSALSVFVYQGLLTVGSTWVKPFVSDIMLTELTGVGGALVVMVGLGLLDLKKLKTGDFLPALVFIILLVLAFPFVPFL